MPRPGRRHPIPFRFRQHTIGASGGPAFTHAGSFGNSNGGSGNAGPISVTPHAVGNFILCTVQVQQALTIISLSATNITWSALTPGFTGVTNSGWHIRTFIGVVTSTSAANTTITYSGTPTSFSDIQMEEFTTTVGTPVLDGSPGHVDGLGTSAWPNLTAAGAGELYYGGGNDTGAASAGSTSGYVYNANADNAGNGTAWNLSVGPGTVTGPTWGDAGQQFGEMVLVSAPVAATAIPDLVMAPMTGA